MLESAIDYTPPGHPALKDIEAHFRVFDEMAARVMGPVYLEPGKDVVGAYLSLNGKASGAYTKSFTQADGLPPFLRCGTTRSYSVKPSCSESLWTCGAQPATRANRRQKEELASKLESLRQSLFKSSPRYAVLRKGLAPSLTQVRRELLRDDEMILDL